MGKRIEFAHTKVHDLLTKAMRTWHKSLHEADVRIAMLMVYPPCNAEGEPTGPALKHHGMPAFAKIKRLSAEDRAIASGVDVRLEIDAARWDDLEAEQQMALLDHELSHLYVKEDDSGVLQQHDDGRPKVFMVPDDWQINGFERVIKRHGIESIELLTLSQVVEVKLGGQLTFPWFDSALEILRKAAEAGNAPGKKTKDDIASLDGVESLTLSVGGKSVTIKGGGKKKKKPRKKKPAKGKGWGASSLASLARKQEERESKSPVAAGRERAAST